MSYIGLPDNAKACHKEEVASYCFHVPDSSIATVAQHEDRNSSRSSEIVTRVASVDKDRCSQKLYKRLDLT